MPELPISTLMRIDGGKTTEEAARLTHAIVTARTREELEAMPVYEIYYERIGRKMYHHHSLDELKLRMADIALGGFGVEAFETRKNGWCEYVNFGDTYSITLVRFNGKFLVTTWGDIAEVYGTPDDGQDEGEQAE